MIVIYPAISYPEPEPATIGAKWSMFGRQFGVWFRVPDWMATLAIRAATYFR